MDSACHATGFISVSPKIAKRRLFFVPHVIGQNFSIPLPVCLSRIVFFAVQIHWQEWLHAKVLLLFVQFTTAPKKSIIVLISSFSLLIHLSRFFFIPSLRNSSFTLAASRKLKIPPRVLLPYVRARGGISATGALMAVATKESISLPHQKRERDCHS